MEFFRPRVQADRIDQKPKNLYQTPLVVVQADQCR